MALSVPMCAAQRYLVSLYVGLPLVNGRYFSLYIPPRGVNLDSLKAVSYVHWNILGGLFLKAKVNAEVVK